MGLTLAQIEALAPDQPSLAAAGKLLKPSAWPLLARDAEGTVVWGEAQGSGSAPYRLSFSPLDNGYKCTCPSRKFPCKHILALMWQFVEHGARFQPGDPPPWVAEWLAKRKAGGRVVTPAEGEAAKPKAPASLALAQAEAPADATTEPAEAAEPEAEDPQAAVRRAKAQAAREAGIIEALDALDVWIGDRLREGLATFPPRATAACRAAAQRLVDGKAAGLALMLDQLPLTLFGLPEPLRADFVVGELGKLHLIAAAYRRQEALPAPLRAELRRTVGWMQNRTQLLEDPAAPRRRARWTVAGTRIVVQPDRLKRIETWLAAEDGATAMLADFVPIAGGSTAPPFAPGERFEAELIYYPSSAPLRAIVSERGASVPDAHGPPAGLSVADALATHHARLAALPWLRDDLLVLGGVRLAEAGGVLLLTADDGGPALPLAPAQEEAALPLAGMDLAGAAAIWDGRVATLLAADTALGPWFDTK